MSVNKDLEHVLILPEDDANRQLANGFWQEVDWSRQRRMQVLAEAGGWIEVLNLFKSQHVTGMDRYPKRFMVLLIDFDSEDDRLNNAKTAIPEHLADRVFVLGIWSEPEALKSDLGTYEKIGSGMAKDCREETDAIWGHDLLRHNSGELERLRKRVRSILFPSV
jgi:hypothetical protein